jgi:parallel beta-helix repeat protein
VSNVVVDNISFQGSNDLGVEVSSGANNVDIKNCVVGFSGVNAVMAYFVNGFIFENSTITNTNNNAMYLAPFCNSAIVRNNTVSNTGLYAGMGASNNDAIQGIIIQGSNNQILNNFVENTGSNGIKFLGENVLIKNNFVNNFCLTTDDAGGIYSSGENNRYGRQVVGNIIMNGRGAPEGSDQENYIPANGIYLDDKTTNVDVLNNTIANVSENGIFVHNSHEINIQGNTIYNTGRASITMNSDVLEPNDPVRNVQLYNNIFVAKHASQLTNWMVSTRDDFYAYGNFDNNAYCRPLNDNNYISTYITDNRWISRFFSVNTWRQNLGKDGYSTKSPVTIPSNANPDDYMRLEYNASTTPRSVSLDGNYIDAKYNRYSGTVSIPAYSSLMLFKITSGTTLQSTPSVTTASTDAASMDVAANTSEKLSVNVLPNPATNRVQIAINAPAGTKKASVTIYSIAGVAVKTIPVTLNTQNIAVDISDWKGGTYIISLKYDDKAITKQFVKL